MRNFLQTLMVKNIFQIGKEIEKNSEQIIENNLRNYYAQKNVFSILFQFNSDNIEEVQLKEDIKPNQNNNIERLEQQQEIKPKEKRKKSMTEDDLDGGKRNKSLDFEDV